MIKQRSLLFRSSEEDLYRAAEELSEPQQDKPAPRPLLESTRQYSEITHGFIWPASGAGGWGGWRGGRWETKTTFVFVVSCKIHTGLLCLGRHVLRLVSLFCSVVKVEDRCSLAPAVDILSYSEREWKGNTAKSALIRKVGVCSCSQHWRQLLFHFMSTNSVCRLLLQGYKEMSHRFGSVRRVRGDNYCALRATLFQVLSHSNKLPVWLREEDGGAMVNTHSQSPGVISTDCRWQLV